MGLPQTPSPPHLYPQALQLKLYQAFIFSIPILFSIILFLLFYLFYLKRRASALSSSQPTLPRSFNQATSYIPALCQVGLKGELKDKLPIVLFDEELRTRDSQCCVCLGEFEIKEELLQVPSCKHVFHVDCICHWLHSNSTCPLCRCSVIPTIKICNLEQPSATNSLWQENINSDQSPQIVSLEQQQQQQQLEPVSDNSNVANFSREEHMIPIDGSSSANTCLRESSILSELSNPGDNGMNYTERESVIIHIPMHNSS